MPLGRDLTRIATAIVVAVCVLFHGAAAPRAQAVPPIDKQITYILPQWLDFLASSPAAVGEQLADLRRRVAPSGEGTHVRLGFTTYVSVQMSPVDPSDTATIQAVLAPPLDAMDKAIARGVANNMPVCLSFITAIRAGVDSLQNSAQNEDRRDMQWLADNSMADGWTTYSRYARKQELIQEAYIRELGRQLAARMALHPDILVAASGDGEIELAAPGTTKLADYSPFAVAEFRDWLRGTGLYAPGQPFAGEAYAIASRYTSDSSLSLLNSDFKIADIQPAIQNWNLKYFDWSLSDPISPDPNAIPSSQYNATGFDPLGAAATSNSSGFDPPRTRVPGNPWSDVWDQFRESLVYRHNREFAKWMTTSADPASGATVPVDRWYSDQIAGDYLFGGTPANPNDRFITSASSIATADVTPYGSLGITSFNVRTDPNDPESPYARTLVGAAPAIAARHVRWGIFEWNPAIPPSSDMTVYDQERALVEQYHPSLLAPFLWVPGATAADGAVQNTLFETMLKSLVTDLNNVPLTLSRTSIDVAATSDGQARTPLQTIRVSGLAGESPVWSITAASPDLDVVTGSDGRSFTVALKAGTYPPGTITDTVTVTPSGPGYAAATLTVTRRVSVPGATSPPQGRVDTPATNDTIVSGEVPVTGWAVDDIGLSSIAICRAPVSGETAPSTPQLCAGLNHIFIGNATFVPGARPDVLAAFPGTPLNDQAGWGYMILTNLLPNGGNGTFTISVIASDVDGHSVLIDQRRIIGQNASSSIPFGTIDTPRQGEIVSGTIINFGWALTQNPKDVSADSSTITVLVDGIAVGRPGPRAARSDITAAFPTLDTTHAVGGYFLDTTTLSNGLHTIVWVVSDNTGATQGVGSRFFTVANP